MIFIENYKKILIHNMVNKDYKQSVNRFTDLTEDEFEDGFLSEIDLEG